MSALAQFAAHLDRIALDASHGLRWQPMTILFVVASAAWVKGPVIVAAGALGDLRARRAFAPAAFCATAALLTGAAVSTLLKELVDRARPPFADPSLTALVTTPATPSFPSGHATTAFAAAAAVGALHPRLRVPVYALAALVAFSRVYLGVHFWLDVIVGAALGIAIGVSFAAVARRLARGA